MSSRRRSRPESGDGRSRRRYSRKSNPAGAIIVLGVIAALLVVAVILARRFDREYQNRDRTPSTEGADRESGRPATRDPSGESDDAPRSPDRPAPEVTGKIVIAADGLFREAKLFHYKALQSEEAGNKDDYKSLLDDCRQKLRKIEFLLEDHTNWLAEAKQKNWEIPSSYNIIEKRIRKYAELEARLPPDGSSPR